MRLTYGSYSCWTDTYSITPLTRTNCDSDPSEHAENPNNWIFLRKHTTLVVSNSVVTIYSKYLRLKRWTTTYFKF